MRALKPQLLRYAIVVTLIVCLLVWFFAGPPRIWRSYVGRTEAEVVQALGAPGYNARALHVHDEEDTYMLWWPYSIGGRLCIEFDRATQRATAQYRNDK